MPDTTVATILTLAIEQAGGDGLCRPNCGCDVSHLAPCDGIQLDCQPAKQITCPACGTMIYVPIASEDTRCNDCIESEICGGYYG